MSGPQRPSRPDHRVRIGVDVAETEGRITGVGRFTLEILRRYGRRVERPDGRVEFEVTPHVLEHLERDDLTIRLPASISFQTEGSHDDHPACG